MPRSNNLPLPVGGVGTVVLAAEWRLGQPIHKPRLMVVRPGAISWRKAVFPFNKHVGLEVGGQEAI